MKLNFTTAITTLTLMLSACGTQSTPQATLEPATPTQALPTPTEEVQIPATETTVPATEAPTESAPVASGVSYANDIAPILATSCNQCHGIQQVKEGLNLTSYDTLMAGSFNGAVITPGNANDSYLVQLIVDGKMPDRKPRLADDQIQLIVDWINQGALNN